MQPLHFAFQFLRSSFVGILPAIAFVAALASPGLCQNISGKLQASVMDESGAVVAAANLTATNEETEVRFTATSGTDGAHSFESLPPETYRVSCAVRASRDLNLQETCSRWNGSPLWQCGRPWDRSPRRSKSIVPLLRSIRCRRQIQQNRRV